MPSQEMTNKPQRIDTTLSVLLLLQAMEVEVVLIQVDKDGNIFMGEDHGEPGVKANLKLMIDMLTEIFEDGYEEIVFSDEMEGDTYILKMHPVQKTYYETYRPKIDNEQLN